jgi:hypothetical protein
MLSYIGFTRLIRIFVSAASVKSLQGNVLRELMWLLFYTSIISGALRLHEFEAWSLKNQMCIYYTI